MKNDSYLTEYYFADTGDQFYPGCPASVSEWFQRDREGSSAFFSINDSANKNGETHHETEK